MHLSLNEVIRLEDHCPLHLRLDFASDCWLNPIRMPQMQLVPHGSLDKVTRIDHPDQHTQPDYFCRRYKETTPAGRQSVHPAQTPDQAL